MLNFTVGPVQMFEYTLETGKNPIPYFRTTEFSALMKENETYIKQYMHASDASKAVFMTGSGTFAMEAAVMNFFSENDRVLVVNGGSFGARFAKLCAIHHISFTEIALTVGQELTADMLIPYENKGYTGFLVNVDETSTGVLYDMNLIGDFCNRNHIFLVADTVSSFLADAFTMEAMHVNVAITASQKALACPPGISVIVMDEVAQERIKRISVSNMYFDVKEMLQNQERGQTPFTPAVGTLIQIHERFAHMEKEGGVVAENERIQNLAKDFRTRIQSLPFEFITNAKANGVTALHPLHASAYSIFTALKDEYGIWVCPNGGGLKDSVFRVGHLGALTVADNTALLDALDEMHKRGRL